MSRRTHDPFPTQGRYRVRYQPVMVDPLELLIAQREAEEEATRAEVASGKTPLADPQDLRGIPCIARGVGGTSPGTNPASAVLGLDRRTR